MARPGVPEEKYQEAFAAFIAEGRRPQDINPSMLQTAVGGGRYERAANFLEQLRSQHVEEQEALIRVPVKPEWFEAFVNQLTELVADASNAQWAPLSEGIQQKINEETHQADLKVKEAEASKELSDSLYRDAKGRTSTLEADLEEQGEELQRVRDQLTQIINDLSAETAKSEQLDKQNTQLKEEKINLEANLKAETTKAAQMEGFYNKANAETERLREQLQTKEEQLQEESKKLVASKKDIGAANKSKQEAERKVLEITNSLTKATGEITALKALHEAETQQVADKNQEIRMLTSSLSDANSKAASLQKEVELVGKSRQEQLSKVEKLEQDLEKIRTSNSDLKAELNFIRKQRELELAAEEKPSDSEPLPVPVNVSEIIDDPEEFDFSDYPEVVHKNVANTVIKELQDSYEYRLGEVIKSQLGFDA
ncbi:hypothetical protein GZ77_26745, partial [Endozoicomonas montiporae]